MPAVHLRGVSWSHGPAVPVLTDVDLHLDAGPSGARWVGVVGANGAGKSTLLRLVAGILAPVHGRVVVDGGVPLLVPQDDGDRTDDVVAFARRWDGHAERLRRRLDLDPDDVEDGIGREWAALSPGQRRRWQVATALAERPDVLLLDEPTNHLDADARRLLLGELARFRGLGLLVSHDRAVLDALTDQTVRVDRGRAALHPGSWSVARDQWIADAAARRRDHDRARRTVRREQRLLADARRDRHGAEAGARRSRREGGAANPDAREAGRRAAQRKAEAALAARVRQQHARLARAERAAAAIDVRRDHRGSVAFAHAVTGRQLLARVRGDLDHAGGQRWLVDVDVAVVRGDRVRVDGPNGAGKTTVLQAVVADLAARGVPHAVLPQALDDPTAELAAVGRLEPGLRGRVLGIAARLGVDPDRVLLGTTPSPGEARKLAVARMLADTATVLVLDEPTNHLDLPAIEVLEDALAQWPGTLLLVTHDESLAGRVARTTWRVDDRRVVVAW